MNVSVIIPVYNYSKFISCAIESVVNQSVAAKEIIVVDDGSTDGLEKALERFKGQLKIIRFDSNRGVSFARNVGVNTAENNIIMFQDADDVSLPNRIELCINALADASVNIVLGMTYQFHDEASGLDANAPEVKNGETSHLLGTCALSFKKDVFAQVGEFDTKLRRGGEDLEWIMRAMMKGYQLTKIDQIFIRKRLHENNTSILKREDEVKIRLKLFRKNFSKI